MAFRGPSRKGSPAERLPSTPTTVTATGAPSGRQARDVGSGLESMCKAEMHLGPVRATGTGPDRGQWGQEGRPWRPQQVPREPWGSAPFRGSKPGWRPMTTLSHVVTQAAPREGAPPWGVFPLTEDTPWEAGAPGPSERPDGTCVPASLQKWSCSLSIIRVLGGQGSLVLLRSFPGLTQGLADSRCSTNPGG